MYDYNQNVSELLQSSDLKKEDLKRYISKGSNDALVLLYLGLTTRKSDVAVQHYWDEDTNEVLFFKRYTWKDDMIFQAEDSREVDEVKGMVLQLIRTSEGSRMYQKVLVEESDDIEILRHYADLGDDKAKDKIELLLNYRHS